MDKPLYIPIDTVIKNPVECTELVKRGDTLLLNIKVFTKAVLTDLTGQSIDIILKKSDGTRIERDVDTSNIANGIIAVKPGQQSTLVEGKVNGELQIYTDGTLSSTNTFTYTVDASLADDILIASQDDIQVLADLRNLISNGQVTIEKYKDSILAIGNSIEAIQALASIKSYLELRLPALESANAQAVVNIENETTANNAATKNIQDLTALNNAADLLNTDLEGNILAGNTLNTELEGNIVTGNALNSDLEGNITTGNTLDNDLKADILAGNTLKSDLEADIATADDKIAAMQAFGDVTQVSQDIAAMKTEINNARNGKTNLDERLDEFDTSLSEKAQQTDLDTANDNIDAIALYNATCSYSANVFTLTLANAPATLPSYFTVRVKMPSAWVDGSTIKIDTKTYTVTNAGFIVDEVVTINFDEVAAKCFFKSGGSSILDTLPAQVSTFTATAGDGAIDFNWTVSDSANLSGFFLTYKQGSAPANINDGVKIDITNPTTTSQHITGATNDLLYTGRIFPYNSKKQTQTQYKVASATPYAGNKAANLAVGSKITVGSYNFIVVDKNHIGYPSNSVTLIALGSVANMQFDSNNNNKFSISSIKTWLNSTFIGYLTALGSNILDTTITTVLPTSGSENITVKSFLASTTELGLANENNISEGSKLAYFNSNPINLSGIAQFLRTPLYTSSIYTRFVDGGGAMGADNANVSKGIRPLLNISGNTKVSLTANASGYYTLV